MDESVAALARLFREHPAWRAAAERIAHGSTSNVYFSHLPRSVWHLRRDARGSRLEEGKAPDPDFVLRFSPGAIRQLETVEGGVGNFALELFRRLDTDEPENRIDLRVVAPFGRLREHGYLRLLFDVGPKLAAYGLRRGIFSVADVAKLVRRARAARPESWEC